MSDNRINVIGIDVGTTSVRLAIVSFQGQSLDQVEVLASDTHDINSYQDGLKFEQKTDEIWHAICKCSKSCIETSHVDSIEAIGFSATCSLVIVNSKSSLERDIIMWMDHRARKEANEITATRNKDKNFLKKFGGICSPEFSIAKLYWLRDNEPAIFNDAEGFIELPDWLVYKCTGLSPAKSKRSLCCATCKYGYDEKNASSFFKILEKELGENIHSKLGDEVVRPGSLVGEMCEDACKALGLDNLKNRKQIRVAASLIDAHAGMLGMLSAYSLDGGMRFDRTLCSLAGTSSCHMLLEKKEVFVRGIWGPYKDVVVDGYYLHEAGQTLSGKLILHIIEEQIKGKENYDKSITTDKIIASLNQEIQTKSEPSVSLHILPSFNGNRSPLANSNLKGAVYGLSIEKETTLLDYYMSAVESLAYETKFIIESLKKAKVDTVLVSGGLMHNEYYMQTLANVLERKILKMSSHNVDFMVIGASLLARHVFKSSDEILNENSIKGLSYKQLNKFEYNPSYDKLPVEYYQKRYKCYKVLVEASLNIEKIESGSK